MFHICYFQYFDLQMKYLFISWMSVDVSLLAHYCVIYFVSYDLQFGCWHIIRVNFYDYFLHNPFTENLIEQIFIEQKFISTWRKTDLLAVKGLQFQTYVALLWDL